MSSIFSILIKEIGYDVMQVFGDTGTCKSAFALYLTSEVVKYGKVLYIDTELNLPSTPPESDRVKLLHLMDFNSLSSWIRSLVKSSENYKLIVIDSITAPVESRLSELKLDEKGKAFQEMYALMYRLKYYTLMRKAFVLVINQISYDFSGSAGSELDKVKPFGGKSKHLSKVALFSRLDKSTPELTKASFVVWKGRKWGRGKKLIEVYVSSKGVEARWVA